MSSLCSASLFISNRKFFFFLYCLPNGQHQILSWYVLGRTKQTAEDGQPGIRKLDSHWVTFSDLFVIIPLYGYFEIWDICGLGGGNSCSHPAFQKGRKQVEIICCSHTVRTENVFIVWKIFCDIFGPWKKTITCICDLQWFLKKKINKSSKL